MKKVASPILAPNRCIFCYSGHRGGEVVDTEYETHDGRVYVCVLHGGMIASALGFAEGEEMERLKGAAAALEQSEKEIALKTSRYDEAMAIIGELSERIEELAGELDQALTRAAQAEAKLAELGQDIGATLAAVSTAPATVEAFRMNAANYEGETD